MGATDGIIRDSIQRLAGVKQTEKVSVVAGEVTAVDMAARTCTVETITGRGRVTIDNVLLMPTVDDGFLLVPEVGSQVIVSYTTYQQAFILLFSSISEVAVVVGDSDVQILTDVIKFNGGTLGGLVKVATLTQKLNALENKVNELLNAFNTHVHTGVTTGGGSSATPAAPISGTLTTTQRADIENDKIKH